MKICWELCFLENVWRITALILISLLTAPGFFKVGCSYFPRVEFGSVFSQCRTRSATLLKIEICLFLYAYIYIYKASCDHTNMVSMLNALGVMNQNFSKKHETNIKAGGFYPADCNRRTCFCAHFFPGLV